MEYVFFISLKEERNGNTFSSPIKITLNLVGVVSMVIIIAMTININKIIIKIKIISNNNIKTRLERVIQNDKIIVKKILFSLYLQVITFIEKLANIEFHSLKKLQK